MTPARQSLATTLALGLLALGPAAPPLARAQAPAAVAPAPPAPLPPAAAMPRAPGQVAGAPAPLPPAPPAPPLPGAAPEITRDLAALPAPVARTRTRLIEAARSGDPERLRAAYETEELPPLLARAGPGAPPAARPAGGAPSAAPGRPAPGARPDPVAVLKAASGDGEGREAMAVVLNLLALPHARLDPGTPRERFLWPGVAALDPRALTPEQRVDALRAMTWREFEESLARGRWVFYRLLIGADGTWHSFYAGD